MTISTERRFCEKCEVSVGESSDSNFRMSGFKCKDPSCECHTKKCCDLCKWHCDACPCHTTPNTEEDFPSKLAMKIVDVVLNKEPYWSRRLEEVLAEARNAALDEAALAVEGRKKTNTRGTGDIQENETLDRAASIIRFLKSQV